MATTTFAPTVPSEAHTEPATNVRAAGRYEARSLALSHRGPACRRTSILAGVVAATVVGAVSLVPGGWNLMAPTVLGAATLLLGLRWVGRRWGK